MTPTALPSREDELADAIADATRDGVRLAITSGGSKSGVGAVTGARAMPMAGFAGIVDYDPPELVLTVRPGTPLAEVQALVAGEGQMLGFEPFDHGPIYGDTPGGATIGGVVAAGVSGSQRVSIGGARDHLLGFRAVSGRGEAFVAGAKVVKNVTGYDLPKLAAGSWGRLFAMTEITLKVLPRPKVSATVAIEGLGCAEAIAGMARAMGSPAEVAAAAHVPGHLGRGAAQTVFRVQGFGPSVSARCTMLRDLFGSVGLVAEPDEAAATIWGDLQSLAPLGRDRPLWRVSVPPSGGGAFVARLEPLGADWMLDWAGGLVWLATDAEPTMVREAAATAGGHAMLLRAPDAMRDAVPAFHPPAPGLAALEARVRRAFDPVGIFETGRF